MSARSAVMVEAYRLNLEQRWDILLSSVSFLQNLYNYPKSLGHAHKRCTRGHAVKRRHVSWHTWQLGIEYQE